jgi:hypothetical protein
VLLTICRRSDKQLADTIFAGVLSWILNYAALERSGNARTWANLLDNLDDVYTYYYLFSYRT